MFAEKTIAVALRVERIETSVAQLRADLQRLDRKLDVHMENLRIELQRGPQPSSSKAQPA